MIEALIFGAYWIVAAVFMARRELRFRKQEREWSPTRQALVALAENATRPGAVTPGRSNTSDGVSTVAAPVG